MEREIFIVVAEAGEYEMRSEWIAGAYSTRWEAEQIAASKLAKAHQDRAAYEGWCAKRSPLYWNLISDQSNKNAFGVLTDEAEASIVAEIGQRPNDGWEADEFHVIAVPLGTWGRYQPE
jgi:hypothetical protein